MKPYHLIVFLFFLPLIGISQNDPILEMARKLRQNVVYLEVQHSNGEFQSGFGFITGEENNSLYFVTAAHVLFGSEFEDTPQKIQVKFYNTLGTFDAAQIKFWEAQDVALLEVTKPRSMNLESSFGFFIPKVNEKVRYIGRNGGFTIHDGGEVISIDRDILKFAPPGGLFPGTSGAPLVGRNGVVGLILEASPEDARAISLSTIKTLLAGSESQFPFYSSKIIELDERDIAKLNNPDKASPQIEGLFLKKHWPTISFGAVALGSYIINRNLYNQGEEIYNNYTVFKDDNTHLEETGKTRTKAYEDAEDLRKRSVPFGVLSLLSTGMTAASGFGLINLSGVQNESSTIKLETTPISISLKLNF